MKASVLIPTQNRHQYVIDAIEGGIAPDFGNMEIIVVDDGSAFRTRLPATLAPICRPRHTSTELKITPAAGVSRHGVPA